MDLKKVLLLFITSFLCVIFCINHLSYKYADTKIDMYFAGTAHSTTVNKELSSVKQVQIQDVNVISEHKRLIITLSTAAISVVIMLVTVHSIKYLFLLVFIIAYFVAYKTLLNHGIYINLLSSLLAILVTPLFVKAYKRVFLNEKGNRLEQLLEKYISKDIKNKILKNKKNDQLGGKKAEISIMFADIRGFTKLSETHTAEAVSMLLNEYFTEIEPIITKYNGVINKFIGDAVLVIFGEPIQDKEHAKNSVLCAHELRKKVKEIQERWLTENKPKIDIGIAINTGEAFVGNIGTSNRFEYTVIGDAVNIASRIEDFNKIYKTHILISENTYSKISHQVDVIKIREVSIKGKSKKINIYEVLRITD